MFAGIPCRVFIQLHFFSHLLNLYLLFYEHTTIEYRFTVL